MSTKIKKNGNWVTVAGGTRMWVGTKAALQAALDAGELVDGTAVMVTDDYDEGTKIYTGTATNSSYVTEGKVTWQWTGRICYVLFEGIKLAADTPLFAEICSGLPPTNGTEFMTVCVQYPQNFGTYKVGFLKTDKARAGKIIADISVGDQPEPVKLYASVSYITSEDAHAI